MGSNDLESPQEQREAQRLERKRAIAAQQAQKLEDEKSQHELNLARLRSLPSELQDDDVAAQIESAEKALKVLDIVIATTLAATEA
jgi:hypothetical protein